MFFAALLPLLLAGFARASSWNNLNCPAPRSPENGLSFIFRNGEMVRFRCHPGYQMIGRSVIHCVNNMWTHPPPDCYHIGRFHHPSNQVLAEGTTDYHNRHAQHSFRASERNRQLFNWEEQEASRLNVYGDGPKRLPLINGIWPSPDQANQVLALGPQSTPGPQALVREEIDIAELRNKQLEELRRRRYKTVEGTGKRKHGRRKNKRKHSVVVDESIPRETIVSLVSTEDGQALSVARAKPLDESAKPLRKHRHHHGEKKANGIKKPRNYDPAGYFNNIIYYSNSRVNTGGIPYYKAPHKPKSAISNNMVELRRRPVEQVQPVSSGGSQLLRRRRPPVDTAQPSQNTTGRFSYYDSSCLETMYQRQVPKIAPQISHGFVYRYVTKKNEQYPFNSFMAVLYKCFNGYIMAGNEQTLYCKKGEWIGEKPQCIKQPTLFSG